MEKIIKNWKPIAIIGAILLAVVIFITVATKTTENKAIRMEEQISESKSGVDIQLKKRTDSIKQLVQIVDRFGEHEQSVIDSVTEARTQLNSGNETDALKTLSVIVEAYPEIKSDVLYSNLMNEISICEQSIANYRDNYNQQIKAYRKLTRTFPNSWFLNMAGYEPIKAEYLEFESSDLVVIEDMFS